LDRNKGKFNVGLYYLHRYLRLTIVYAFILGFIATLIVYVGIGPYWYDVNKFSNACRNAWWRQFLYSKFAFTGKKKHFIISNFYIFCFPIVNNLFPLDPEYGVIRSTIDFKIYNIFNLKLTFLGIVHGSNVVPGGGHATLFRLSSLHLSTVAMEEVGTRLAGRCWTYLSSCHLLRLR
jgi:hypothetical protein